MCTLARAVLATDYRQVEHLLLAGVSPDEPDWVLWEETCRQRGGEVPECRSEHVVEAMPLAVAVGAGDVVGTRLLLRAGAKAHCLPGHDNSLFVAAVHWFSRDERVAVNLVRELLDHGADVNAAEACGAKPLTVAVWSGSMTAVRMLLAAGADPYDRSGNGEAPAECAVREGHVEALRTMLEACVPSHEVRTWLTDLCRGFIVSCEATLSQLNKVHLMLVEPSR